jgi:predicted  nucleic acid-binding Zn-ribbon protein
MSKRKRREPMDKEDTAADDSPFRPTGGVLKKLDALDVDATTPGLPASLLDSMSDSVEEKPTLSPFARDEMPAPGDIPTDPRARPPKTPHPESDKATQVARPPSSRSKGKSETKKPEPKKPPVMKSAEKKAEKDSPPGRSTQPIDRKRKKPTPEPAAPAPAVAPPVQPVQAVAAPDTISPKLLELSAKLDQQINATLDVVGALRQNVEESDGHRQELLSEAKTVNRNYKQLVEKIIAERDALSKELSHVRSQYAADAKNQAQAFTELQRDLEKERRESERKLRESEDEVGRQNQRITELEAQLSEAIASRDRIADRVRQVETTLEQSVLPLREELDQARSREAQARIELEGAGKEIAALKLLAAGPPSRD